MGPEPESGVMSSFSTPAARAELELAYPERDLRSSEPSPAHLSCAAVRRYLGEMSSGLEALIAAADSYSEPLDFEISVSTGGASMRGRVAPASSWYNVNKRASTQAAGDIVKSWGRKGEEQKAQADQKAQSVSRLMDYTRDIEGADVDELTLVDVQLVLSGGGGVQLPVVRVPIASIDAWWIVPGKEIKGASGGFFAVGGSFPIGD